MLVEIGHESSSPAIGPGRPPRAAEADYSPGRRPDRQRIFAPTFSDSPASYNRRSASSGATRPDPELSRQELRRMVARNRPLASRVPPPPSIPSDLESRARVTVAAPVSIPGAGPGPLDRIWPRLARPGRPRVDGRHEFDRNRCPQWSLACSSENPDHGTSGPRARAFPESPSILRAGIRLGRPSPGGWPSNPPRRSPLASVAADPSSNPGRGRRLAACPSTTRGQSRG